MISDGFRWVGGGESESVRMDNLLYTVLQRVQMGSDGLEDEKVKV